MTIWRTSSKERLYFFAGKTPVINGGNQEFCWVRRSSKVGYALMMEIIDAHKQQTGETEVILTALNELPED